MAKGYGRQPSRAAVDAAHDLREGPEEVTLSTGVRAILKAVAAPLIDAVTARIKDPEIPMFPNQDHEGRLEPNPTDANYIKAVQEADRKRATASIDAMVMFGVELVDPIPPDDEWLKQLKYLEKRGELDLSEFNFDDPMDREFVFKRFIAVGSNDLIAISKQAGVSKEALKRAAATFPSDGPRKPD